MSSTASVLPISKPRLWTGRVISGLAIVFLAFDGAMKLVRPAPVVEACAHLGLPLETLPGIGLLLLFCTLLYTIPRTALVGAVLMTGYLGGAVATHVRAGDPAFPVIFPVVFGALLWTGLYLRDARVRTAVRGAFLEA
jgi:hypothetical protein